MALFGTQFVPKSILDTYLFQKRRFLLNGTKTNEKSTNMTLHRLPKRSKIDPRASQERLFFVFVFDFVFGTILVPFWLPKCLPLGTLFGAKIDPKNDQKLNFKKDRPKSAPRRPKSSPGTPQDAPRAPQDAPKRLPRRPRDAPRSPQDAPRCPPEPPGTTQNAFSKDLAQ